MLGVAKCVGMCYYTTLKDGLAAGVLSDVLAVLSNTPANIPTEVLTQILKEYYIDNCQGPLKIKSELKI